MGEVQLKSERPKKIGINSWCLMQLDDLMKFTILDPFMGFETRKIHPINEFSEVNKNLVGKLITKQMVFSQKEATKIMDSLKLIFSEEKLYYLFNIKYRSWVDDPMKFYLRTLSLESPVIIAKCTRYQNEINGLKVIAKINIAKGTKIRCLTGIYKPIDLEREKLLKERNLNYSVIQTTRIVQPVLMLGTASILNHDCNPNCIYLTISKTELIIQTIENISTGDELFCFYSENYFGPKNENCECYTCEKKESGFFLKGKAQDSKILHEHDQEIDTINEKVYLQDSIIDNTLTKLSDINSNLLHGKLKTSEKVNFNQCNDRLETVVSIEVISKQISIKNITFPEKGVIYTTSKILNALDLCDDYLKILYTVEPSFLEHVKSGGNKTMEKIVMSSKHDIINALDLCTDKMKVVSPFTYSPSKQAKPDNVICVKNSDVKCNHSISYYLNSDCKLSNALVVLQKMNHLIVDYQNIKYKNGSNTFCLFCEEFQTKFIRHLKTVHKDQYIVDKFIKNELNVSALNYIRNQGLAHFQELTGIIIPSMKTRSDTTQKVVKVKCDNCLAYFSKDTLWHHYSSCKKFTQLMYKYRQTLWRHNTIA